MKVCETVRTIAGAIGDAHGDLSPRHRLLIELFRLMPLYCEAKRLDAWESAILAALPRVKDAADADTSEMGSLLEEVFEFGRFNLYTRFDAGGTGDCYTKLSKLLQQAGIESPKVFRFTGF